MADRPSPSDLWQQAGSDSGGELAMSETDYRCPGCGRASCTGEDCSWPDEAGIARPEREAASGCRPGVANVRLVGPPEVIDAANALLADLCGDAWQPSTRKPGRHEGGDHLQYGTLIVPVPR